MQLIRIAMLTGVLLFGGMVWYMQRSGTAPVQTLADYGPLLTYARVFWGVAIAGLVAIWFAFQNARGAQGVRRVATLSIIAWALGEGVALLGGVVWMLTGSPAWYVPGLVFLVLTLLLFTGRGS